MLHAFRTWMLGIVGQAPKGSTTEGQMGHQMCVKVSKSPQGNARISFQ